MAASKAAMGQDGEVVYWLAPPLTFLTVTSYFAMHEVSSRSIPLNRDPYR
jgi:hypothetical protein